MNKKQITKNNWARFLSIFVLMGILLAACTPQTTVTPTGALTAEATEATSEPTEAPTQQATPTPSRPIQLEVDGADLAGIVVRVVHPWAGEMADTLESLAMQFSLSNEWDIWVEMEPMGSEISVVEGLQSDINNRSLPGIVVATPYMLDQLNGQMYSVNLMDYYTDVDWGLSPEGQADIPSAFLAPYRSDRLLSALPVAPQATLLFFNQTWAQELGFAGVPTDPTDLQKMLCDAAYQNNIDDVDRTDGTGGWVVNLDPNVLLSWFTAFGGELDPNSLAFNTESGQAAFGYLEQLRSEGCAWESINPDPYEYFSERLTIMFAGETSQIPYLQNWMATLGSEDLWTVAPFVGTDDNPVVVDGPAMLMTANSAEIQMASWLFMRYLLSAEAQAEIAQASYSIPVRQSALDLMGDFTVQNPQWLLAYQYTANAVVAPTSELWGMKQWVLQDAVFRLLQLDVDDTVRVEDVLRDADAALDAIEESMP
jgi:hypothetical protein